MKYPKPNILLLDMSDECGSELTNAGYSIRSGSLGTPYPIAQSDNLFPLGFDSCTAPGFEEQEIVFADLSCPDASEQYHADPPGEGVDAHWESASNGKIDPRPLFSLHLQEIAERLLSHGGIFVLLMDAKYVRKISYGSSSRYSGFDRKRSVDVSSWNLLKEVNNLRSKRSSGKEITYTSTLPALSALLAKTGEATYFSTCFGPQSYQQERWTTLARNKYEEPVAGLLRSGNTPLPGTILLLPQMPNLHEIIVRLVEDWCFEWSPHLFPHHEGSRWLHRPEYEVPRITLLRHEIEKLQTTYESQVATLKGQIEEIHTASGDWYALQNGTGDALVVAVMNSLKALGFAQVVDVDAEATENGTQGSLREDIRVHDHSPILIIDVKGVSGTPADDEATQSEKHALMRMKEYKGDVKPLTIINHQRNIPPLDRITEPFRAEIVENAVQTDLGLMTTWDLFCLLKNTEKLNWTFDQVAPIFYRSGRIYPIPEHYRVAGKVVHKWEHSFGIVPIISLAIGEILAVEKAGAFEEFSITSLRVDNKEVTEAALGSNCGVGSADAKNNIKVGDTIYHVKLDEIAGH